jgi:hypothetical protein
MMSAALDPTYPKYPRARLGDEHVEGFVGGVDPEEARRQHLLDPSEMLRVGTHGTPAW